MALATRLNALNTPWPWAIALAVSGGAMAAPTLAQSTGAIPTVPIETEPLPSPEVPVPDGDSPNPVSPAPRPDPTTPARRPNIFQTEDIESREFATYRLGPGDSFFVSVPRFPELSFQATLDIQGNIIVPLAGAVNFNGLTLGQTAQLLTTIYDRYVVNPDVTLTLVAQRGVEVTILGEVVRPGFYPLGAPQISTALLTAGGTTEWADLRAIRIQRQLVNGDVLESNIDLFTPLKDGLPLPDVAMQDGDVVIVERLDPGELDEYDRALVSRTTLARPVIAVRVLNYGSGGGLATFNLPNGSRFIDAIANGGVSSETTNLGQIALVRFDEEAGQAVTTILDGGAAFRGDPTQNPQLQHNDVIIMNRSLLARLTYGINVFTQPFRDVLGFLLFFDSLSDSASNLFRP